MNDYYERSHGCAFHPGGRDLTKYAVDKCAFLKGAKLCDIGCGCGDTVDQLNEIGFSAVGIEPSAPMSGGRNDIINADAANTGLASGDMDGVLFECVLSLVADPKAALIEANRILRRGGKLIISDLYAAEEAVFSEGPIGRVFSEDGIKDIISECGFETFLFEDHTRKMRSMAIQMIMDGDDVCGLFRKIREIRGRYFLLIAGKVSD